MRAYVLGFLAAAIMIAIVFRLRGCAREANAVRVIEQNGAAISKPIPTVTVFVPRTNIGREKEFGDEQLRAIVPAMRDLEKFNALNLSGSSITDSGIRHLKTLTELERLDVHETAITVDGLVELQHLPKLSLMVVSRGQYADEALTALKRAFPNVTIHEVGRPTTTATPPAA